MGGKALKQATWAAPMRRSQAEQSILEVVEQETDIVPIPPQYRTGQFKAVNKVGAPTADDASVTALTVPPKRQSPPQSPATMNNTAPNSKLISEPEPSTLTTTQAMVARQQRHARVFESGSKGKQGSAPRSPRFAKGSFENEFYKAYELIGDGNAKPAPVSGAPTVRVAQRNSVNAVKVNHSHTAQGSSITNGSDFDLVPESSANNNGLQLPPLNAPNDVTPGEFQYPELTDRNPHENSSFSPPNSMVFEVPGETVPAVQPQRAPDILPSLEKESPATSSEVAFDSPPEPVASPKEHFGDPVEEFAPVKTSKTWEPPVIPKPPTEHMGTQSASAEPLNTVETIDEGVAWWKSRVGQPLHVQNSTQPVDTNGLVLEALRSSPLIKSVSKTPLIRELQVVEADAEFDAVRFLNSQFQDRVDPVGNSLTTGGEPFLEDNIWTAEGGIRKRLRNGGDYSLSQTLGFQNSNSTFFTPQDQGTATLALNVTQPLLRGRGRYINQAQILIAQSTGSAAWDTFKAELQEELEGMVSAYWDLYLQRSIFLQKKRNVERGQVMLDRLMGRKDLDSLPAQIARAKSAVLTRRTELANAFRDVRNAETEIRRRIADKNWQASQSVELLPIEMPFAQLNGLELEQVVYTALENRPEIAEAIRRIRIAGVQRDVSANELLPDLSLLLGTYVSSLRGDTGILNAFQDQFGQVTPGYSVGLEYELPYRNRAARSRLQQRNLQLRRLQNELENVIQNVIAESQVATRQVTSAFETLKAAREAVVASRADLLQNQKRWESFALVEGDLTDGQSPTVVLDQLLDSQERLAQAENVFAEAEQGLKVAEVSLQRTMGTLLMHQKVDFSRSVKCDVPAIHINKADAPSAANVVSPAPTDFNRPEFPVSPQGNPAPLNPPEFVQKKSVQPRVGTLRSILPTPSDQEVAQLMQPPTFQQVSAGQASSGWAHPNRASSPTVGRSDYSAEQSRILQTGHRSDGSAPQFDFGYPAK